MNMKFSIGIVVVSVLQVSICMVDSSTESRIDLLKGEGDKLTDGKLKKGYTP